MTNRFEFTAFVVLLAPQIQHVLVADDQRGGSFRRILAIHGDSREETDKVVVVVLRVFFQRMIVTSSASDTSSEKGLRD